ncbi:MAG TPA: matrixin family metalloprotease [Vicinamibacterales bacterium]|nr:matrixin family metalloprotease [Vicinamibacterales bacterium]
MRLVAPLILIAALTAPLFGQQQGPVPGRRGGPRGPRTYTYFIEPGKDATGFRPGDRELATWALRDWERHADGRIRFVAVEKDASRIRINWVSPREGQYGETRRAMVGNRMVAMVYIRPDTTSLGPAVSDASLTDPLFRDAIVYLTCLHELGHAIGLTHTADDRDIMYSFEFGGDVRVYFDRYRNQLRNRAAIATTTGLSPHDIERLRALFQPRRVISPR